MPDQKIPAAAYGILRQNQLRQKSDEISESVRNLGYAVIDAGYSAAELEGISRAFDRTRQLYIDSHGEARLGEIDEYHTIRLPLAYGDDAFLRLATNENLISMLQNLILGKFILNQQNGIVNPPGENYNQAAWHRDLPYQHFVSSRPLAINALFCVDDFTAENGATFVLPASHKAEDFPSERYIQNNAVQIEAAAGSYILLDCMAFHAGGFNRSKNARRAVNHVYNIPYFKQQINIPGSVDPANLSDEQKDLLGFNNQEPGSIRDYLATRKPAIGDDG